MKTKLLNDYPAVSTPYINYYEATWLHGNYDFALWKVYQRTLDGRPRTNNVSEGGNNAIRVAFGCSNPVIWKCLDKVKEFQGQTDLVIRQHLTGQDNNIPPRRKWVTRERRIKNIVATYNSSMDKLHYLNNLGCLFAASV